jgi:Gas vesicle synthesis protein GvpL/GvpF
MTKAGLAHYVYCVVPAGSSPRLEGLAGVDPSFEVGRLSRGRLSAIVSQVRLGEFGAEALSRNLDDLEWLARTARAHNAVLTSALSGKAVVPLRLCTIFADEHGVRRMLEREQAPLLAALSQLRGRAEWSVKVMADAGGVNAAATERGFGLDPAEAEGPGRAYFARKKLERWARVRARASAEHAVEEIDARLRAHAAAATRLPPQDRRLSGRSGEMVLNGAYLVERSRATMFTSLAEELGARNREIGLALELTGPFAPYNFVPAMEQRT